MTLNNFPGGWIGRRGPKNYRDEVLIVLNVFFLGAGVKMKSAKQNQKHLTKRSDTFRKILPLYLLTVSVSSRLQKWQQNVGVNAEIWH